MGIVSSFRFNTFVVPEQVTYFAASVRWANVTKAAAGIKAIQDFALNSMPAELNMRLFFTRSFSNLEGMYYGDLLQLKAALQPLLNATGGTLTMSKTGSWLDQLTHFGNGMALNQTHPYDMVRFRVEMQSSRGADC